MLYPVELRVRQDGKGTAGEGKVKRVVDAAATIELQDRPRANTVEDEDDFRWLAANLIAGQGWMARGRSSGPRRVLENDPITVWIFKSCAVAVPVGIERRNRLEACASHHLDGGFPFGSIGEIKDQKMVVGRRPTRRTAVSMRKLKVIRGAGMPQHHTVEAVMIFEPRQDLQPQSVAVKADQRVEIITGPGYA